MSRTTVLAAARRAAEQSMVDTVTIRRVVSVATDGETGQTTPSYQTLYSGRARIQQTSGSATRDEAGQASLLLVSRIVSVPMSAVGIRADDEVTVTASLDPALVGRTFVVNTVVAKTEASARRLVVVERTS